MLYGHKILVQQSLRRSFADTAVITLEKSLFKKKNFFFTQTTSFVKVEDFEVRTTGSGIRLQLSSCSATCWSCDLDQVTAASLFSSVKWRE